MSALFYEADALAGGYIDIAEAQSDAAYNGWEEGVRFLSDEGLPLSTVYGPLVCQVCRAEHPTRLDANVCSSTHPREAKPQRFLACRSCSERVFVNQRCTCGIIRKDQR